MDKPTIVRAESWLQRDIISEWEVLTVLAAKFVISLSLDINIGTADG